MIRAARAGERGLIRQGFTHDALVHETLIRAHRTNQGFELREVRSVAMQPEECARRIGVRATPDQIWDLIADLPGWDRWNPVETGLEGTIAFGADITLTEQIGDLPERRAATRVAAHG